ncbi:MAG TPA: hypothetical protein VGV38_22350 [Pyrinomonadaceae bacterium]|nr:hypothetical protein [Pyrinomonadaceae bacterium]
MGLAYRLIEEQDLPAVQRLWKEEAGWGTFAEELWQRFVVEAPMGGVSGTLATDTETGRVVGQFAFVPSLVSVGGRTVRAFRPAAPIVARSLRFRSANPLSHPLVAMYRHAVKALRERGDGLIYMVPDARWVRLFRMFPFLQTGSFPLWRLPLPLAAPLPLGEGFTAAPLDTWDERVDRLWEVSRRLHGCMVVRDSRTLPWKLGDAQYDVLGVERGGELVGLSASRRKGEQWLVCDVLAADTGDSLRATLASVANLAHDKSLEGVRSGRIVPKVTVLTTPQMEPAVRGLGFTRDAYDFPLVVHVLDPALKEAINPAHWYVSAND